MEHQLGVKARMQGGVGWEFESASIYTKRALYARCYIWLNHSPMSILRDQIDEWGTGAISWTPHFHINSEWPVVHCIMFWISEIAMASSSMQSTAKRYQYRDRCKSMEMAPSVLRYARPCTLQLTLTIPPKVSHRQLSYCMILTCTMSTRVLELYRNAM